MDDVNQVEVGCLCLCFGLRLECCGRCIAIKKLTAILENGWMDEHIEVMIGLESEFKKVINGILSLMLWAVVYTAVSNAHAFCRQL